VERVAVAVHSDGNHVGLLYRDDEPPKLWLLHFCWHRTLRKQEPNESQLVLWIEPTLEREQANQVVLWCETMYSNHARGTLTYGLSQPDGFFDVEGNITTADLGQGLTCATFILAVFHLAGTPLVQYATWKPRSEDEAWRAKIIEHLRSDRRVERQHIVALERDTIQVRFRPLEVAGAASAEDIPVTLEVAVERAFELTRMLVSRLLDLPAGRELDAHLEFWLFGMSIHCHDGTWWVVEPAVAVPRAFSQDEHLQDQLWTLIASFPDCAGSVEVRAGRESDPQWVTVQTVAGEFRGEAISPSLAACRAAIRWRLSTIRK
jgi:hypothetical protein